MTSPSHTSEIERELAELGEAPPSDEELALLDGLDQHEDIAGVARLVELSEPFEFDELSQLETHRAWRTIEQRLASTGSGGAGSATLGERRPIGGGPRRWLFAAVGVAAAAAVVLIIVRPFAPDPVAQAELDAEQLAKLGEQARLTLKALDDGKTDTQRAAQLAAEYQARLEEQGG